MFFSYFHKIKISNIWLVLLNYSLFASQSFWMVRDPSPHTAAKTSGPIVYIEGRVQFSIMLREKRFHSKTYIYTNNIYGHVLFVCLGLYVPQNNFSLIWRHLHYRWRVSFDLHSELMDIESKEGSLACRTYCDAGQQFIMVITKEP